jgi:hypothetical protein
VILSPLLYTKDLFLIYQSPVSVGDVWECVGGKEGCGDGGLEQ